MINLESMRYACQLNKRQSQQKQLQQQQQYTQQQQQQRQQLKSIFSQNMQNGKSQCTTSTNTKITTTTTTTTTTTAIPPTTTLNRNSNDNINKHNGNNSNKYSIIASNGNNCHLKNCSINVAKQCDPTTNESVMNAKTAFTNKMTQIFQDNPTTMAHKQYAVAVMNNPNNNHNNNNSNNNNENNRTDKAKHKNRHLKQFAQNNFVKCEYQSSYRQQQSQQKKQNQPQQQQQTSGELTDNNAIKRNFFVTQQQQQQQGQLQQLPYTTPTVIEENPFAIRQQCNTIINNIHDVRVTNFCIVHPASGECMCVSMSMKETSTTDGIQSCKQIQIVCNDNCNKKDNQQQQQHHNEYEYDNNHVEGNDDDKMNSSNNNDNNCHSNSSNNAKDSNCKEYDSDSSSSSSSSGDNRNSSVHASGTDGGGYNTHCDIGLKKDSFFMVQCALLLACEYTELKQHQPQQQLNFNGYEYNGTAAAVTYNVIAELNRTKTMQQRYSMKISRAEIGQIPIESILKKIPQYSLLRVNHLKMLYYMPMITESYEKLTFHIDWQNIRMLSNIVEQHRNKNVIVRDFFCAHQELLISCHTINENEHIKITICSKSNDNNKNSSANEYNPYIKIDQQSIKHNFSLNVTEIIRKFLRTNILCEKCFNSFKSQETDSVLKVRNNTGTTLQQQNDHFIWEFSPNVKRHSKEPTKILYKYDKDNISETCLNNKQLQRINGEYCLGDYTDVANEKIIQQIDNNFCNKNNTENVNEMKNVALCWHKRNVYEFNNDDYDVVNRERTCVLNETKVKTTSGKQLMVNSFINDVGNILSRTVEEKTSPLDAVESKKATASDLRTTLSLQTFGHFNNFYIKKQNENNNNNNCNNSPQIREIKLLPPLSPPSSSLSPLTSSQQQQHYEKCEALLSYLSQQPNSGAYTCTDFSYQSNRKNLPDQSEISSENQNEKYLLKSAINQKLCTINLGISENISHINGISLINKNQIKEIANASANKNENENENKNAKAKLSDNLSEKNAITNEISDKLLENVINVNQLDNVNNFYGTSNFIHYHHHHRKYINEKYSVESCKDNSVGKNVKNEVTNEGKTFCEKIYNGIKDQQPVDFLWAKNEGQIVTTFKTAITPAATTGITTTTTTTARERSTSITTTTTTTTRATTTRAAAITNAITNPDTPTTPITTARTTSSQTTAATTITIIIAPKSNEHNKTVKNANENKNANVLNRKSPSPDCSYNSFYKQTLQAKQNNHHQNDDEEATVTNDKQKIHAKNFGLIFHCNCNCNCHWNSNSNAIEIDCCQDTKLTDNLTNKSNEKCLSIRILYPISDCDKDTTKIEKEQPERDTKTSVGGKYYKTSHSCFEEAISVNDIEHNINDNKNNHINDDANDNDNGNDDNLKCNDNCNIINHRIIIDFIHNNNNNNYHYTDNDLCDNEVNSLHNCNNNYNNNNNNNNKNSNTRNFYYAIECEEFEASNRLKRLQQLFRTRLDPTRQPQISKATTTTPSIEQEFYIPKHNSFVNFGCNDNVTDNCNYHNNNIKYNRHDNQFHNRKIVNEATDKENHDKNDQRRDSQTSLNCNIQQTIEIPKDISTTTITITTVTPTLTPTITTASDNTERHINAAELTNGELRILRIKKNKKDEDNDKDKDKEKEEPEKEEQDINDTATTPAKAATESRELTAKANKLCTNNVTSERRSTSPSTSSSTFLLSPSTFTSTEPLNHLFRNYETELNHLNTYNNSNNKNNNSHNKNINNISETVIEIKKENSPQAESLSFAYKSRNEAVRLSSNNTTNNITNRRELQSQQEQQAPQQQQQQQANGNNNYTDKRNVTALQRPSKNSYALNVNEHLNSVKNEEQFFLQSPAINLTNRLQHATAATTATTVTTVTATLVTEGLPITQCSRKFTDLTTLAIANIIPTTRLSPIKQIEDVLPNNNNNNNRNNSNNTANSDNHNNNEIADDTEWYRSAFVGTKLQTPPTKLCFANSNKIEDISSRGPLMTFYNFSEFDTQQFSNLLKQQQQQQEHTGYLLIQPDAFLQCYDELLPYDERNDSIKELLSSSSSDSSECDCDNCQNDLVNANANFNTNLSDTQQKNILHKETESDLIKLYYHSLSEDPKIQSLENREQKSETVKMREVNGQLRGLLKKPNRPPPTRKNRVVFDETRNEFFEADYIILIREDCAYDEEDEEPCTCGEHELVRLCCEEGCQCNYVVSSTNANTDDNRAQNPKYTPPTEFVDDAALSPPDGYKDNSLKNSLDGALSGHIFGAQHLQQLQVIQRLQQQRAAMLAARNSNNTAQILTSPPPPTSADSNLLNQQTQQHSASSTSSATTIANSTTINSNNIHQEQQDSIDDDNDGDDDDDDEAQTICTECAECAECAAKQLQQDTECSSPQCQEEMNVSLGVPMAIAVPVPAMTLLPLHTSSPERRITQKEIIAGEERPRYVLQAQYKSSPVNERLLLREAGEDAITAVNPLSNRTTTSATGTTYNSLDNNNRYSDIKAHILSEKVHNTDADKVPFIASKETASPTQISGILKGGKLWKQDSLSQHSDDQNNTTSEDETGSNCNTTIKRSVRFVTEDLLNNTDDVVDGHTVQNNDDNIEDNQINELIPIKKHSTLFNNALRPNSAVRQLFPSVAQPLTSEVLRAFDESKRSGCLVSNLPGISSNAGDSDTLRRTMERNILRRSLIKKKTVKADMSLEERIKQLTCDIDDDNDPAMAAGINGEIVNNNKMNEIADLSNRDGPAGEETPQKFITNGHASSSSDKSFSPNSSVSSSSSGSSAYKKITEIFNRDKKSQEKIMEMEENPIVIIPQECRCPAAPDLGMGIQVPVVHTQIHRTPPRQTESKRQFLAPLTACVAGNKDDLSSYYTLAAAHHQQHHHQKGTISGTNAADYNIMATLAGGSSGSELSLGSSVGQNSNGSVGVSGGSVIGMGDDVRKVAPDVIAGTPGQEHHQQQHDELVVFAQQEAQRTEKIKKRYTNEPNQTVPTSTANTTTTNKNSNNKDNNNKDSDDDESNDYGFNKRPSVRGIKPKFSTTNEILQQMQDQLHQQIPVTGQIQAIPSLAQTIKSYTLPKQASASAMTKQISQQPSPQNIGQHNHVHPHSHLIAHEIVIASSQQQLLQPQQMCTALTAPAAVAPLMPQIPQAAVQLQSSAAAIEQQQTEQRTWSFYTDTGEHQKQQQQLQQLQHQQHQQQQQTNTAATMQHTYYHTMPAGAMFRHTMIQHQQQQQPQLQPQLQPQQQHQLQLQNQQQHQELQQQQLQHHHLSEDAFLYNQNCQTINIAALETQQQQPQQIQQQQPQQQQLHSHLHSHAHQHPHLHQHQHQQQPQQSHYGHYVRSPTRRPESPPPLRNYHQTMVLIPYNAETYSQFAATNIDPKMAHIQRQNILEYQQVTQQTIRVPIGYALPGMQLHVVAGRGHTAHYATAAAPIVPAVASAPGATAAAHHHHHQQQSIMTQRYHYTPESNMNSGVDFSGERGAPEGAASAISHSDCNMTGNMLSPTINQQPMPLIQQQHQQQFQAQQLTQQQQQPQQQQQQQQQQQGNVQTSATATLTAPGANATVAVSATTAATAVAQGSVYYAMNV